MISAKFQKPQKLKTQSWQQTKPSNFSREKKKKKMVYQYMIQQTTEESILTILQQTGMYL